jgi:hypothetical protein
MNTSHEDRIIKIRASMLRQALLRRLPLNSSVRKILDRMTDHELIEQAERYHQDKIEHLKTKHREKSQQVLDEPALVR